MSLFFGMSQQKSGIVVPPPPAGYSARWEFENTLVDESNQYWFNSSDGTEDYVSGGKPNLAVRKPITPGNLNNSDFTSWSSNPIFEYGNSYSVSFWYKVQAFDSGSNIPTPILQGIPGLACKGLHTAQNIWWLRYWSANGLPPDTIKTDMLFDTWYHFVITTNANIQPYGSEQTLVYMNGNSTPIYIVYDISSMWQCNEVDILCQDYGSTVYNQMDSLYFYPRLLTTVEIAQLFNSGNGFAPPNAGVIAGSQTLCCGSSCTPVSGFTSSSGASGGVPTYSYQWQYSDDDSVWNDIYGETSTTYTETNYLSASRWYRRKVTDSRGAIAYSNEVLVTYESAPSVPAPTIANKTVCIADNQMMSISSSSYASGIYKWYSDSNLTTLVNTGRNYNPNKSSAGTYTYYVVELSNGGCKGYSQSVTLIVNSPPTTTNPSNATVAHGGNTSFTVTDGGVTHTMKWQRKIGAGAWTNITAGTTPNDGCTYSGYTTKTLTLTGVPSGMNGYLYRISVIGVSPTYCTAYSAQATLTVT